MSLIKERAELKYQQIVHVLGSRYAEEFGKLLLALREESEAEAFTLEKQMETSRTLRSKLESTNENINKLRADELEFERREDEKKQHVREQ